MYRRSLTWNAREKNADRNIVTTPWRHAVFLVTGLLCVALASGCVSYVHSPPARVMALESAKALNPGETGIQVEAGGGGGGTGVGLAGVTARARHGVVEGLDVNGEFGYLRLSPDVDLVDGDHGNVFMARAGLKYAARPWIAFTLGLGGGGWTGGGFFSPDIAMILSWENPYFVPFVSGGGYLSQPINAQPVSLKQDAVLSDMPFVGVPDFTVGWTAGAGFRIPISHKKDGKTKSALLLGVRFLGAAHDEDGQRDHETYILGSGAFEYVFGGR